MTTSRRAILKAIPAAAVVAAAGAVPAGAIPPFTRTGTLRLRLGLAGYSLRDHLTGKLQPAMDLHGFIDKDGDMISWPPDHDVTMNVLGLEDASRDLVSVRLPGRVVVPVASIPSLTMLKLLAWDDRRHDKRQHDGVDLKYR